MKQTRAKWNFILWNENVGFSLMIVLSWLTELFHIPHLVFGEAFTPNWQRALLRTFVIMLIWGWVHLVTKRLLRRLYHLEEFLRICGWCRKVCSNDEWLTTEEYFNSNFAMHTTHGVCPECLQKNKLELGQKKNPPPALN
jgi:hypothetical protein